MYLMYTFIPSKFYCTKASFYKIHYYTIYFTWDKPYLLIRTMRLGWCYFYLKLGLSPRLSSQSIILLKADLWLLLSTYNFGNDTNTRPELILCSGILDKCLLVQIQISWLSERVTLWVAWPQSWIYIYTNLHKFVKLTILMRILNQGNVFKD